MKYYKIQVKLGHVGCGKEMLTWVYIKANDILKAIAKAKQLPAVKHSKLPQNAIEISKEEYVKGMNEGDYFNKIDQIFNV